MNRNKVVFFSAITYTFILRFCFKNVIEGDFYRHLDKEIVANETHVKIKDLLTFSLKRINHFLFKIKVFPCSTNYLVLRRFSFLSTQLSNTRII